ncbi:hypothetical protein FO584_07340 [Bacillus thuringiensis]|nr:hypothetical protein [Bacillus thuringiensis]
MQYFHRDLAPTQSLLIHSYFHASLIGISLLTQLLSRYLRAVRLPPQISVKAKKLDGGCTQLIKVSLYCNIKISILGIFHPTKRGMIVSSCL